MHNNLREVEYDFNIYISHNRTGFYVRRRFGCEKHSDIRLRVFMRLSRRCGCSMHHYNMLQYIRDLHQVSPLNIFTTSQHSKL